MNRYLLLVLAAFALMLTAPTASAVRIRVVDANPPDCTSNTQLTACSIVNLTDTYTMNFVPANLAVCQAAYGTPGVLPGDLGGYNWCTVLVNFTRPAALLTAFNFTFTVPQQGINDDYNTVICSGIPTGASSTLCPTAPLSAGDIVNASFSASPGVAQGQAAYLFVDFTYSPETTSLTLSPQSVPEPGELGLFGLGLLAVGVGYGWKKRRQTSRSN